MQETTAEFSYRLGQAIEAHPLAPPTPHGRQRWLLRKLKAEQGVEVSSSSVNKWFRGLSKPRGDTVRKLARVLDVDEVWLALGKKPESVGSAPGAVAPSTTGAALVVAGLIELHGGRVSFADKSDTAHLHVSMSRGNFDLIAVTPQSQGETTTFVVPEPVGDARLVGVITKPSEAAGSACVHLLDLTNVPRKNMGGFSAVQLERRSAGKFKAEGTRSLLSPLPNMDALCS